MNEADRHHVDSAIKAHEQNMPHDEQPCAYFSAHRLSVVWVMSICGCIILTVGGYLASRQNEIEATLNSMTVNNAVLSNDVIYIKETVTELKHAIKK